MVKKTPEQKKVINNLENFYISREVINFFRDYVDMLSDANNNAKQNESKGKGLKILTPKQMIQRFPIALAQVKAGNNSENILNEIRQIYLFTVSIKRNYYSIQQLNEIIIKNEYYIDEF